MISISTCDSLLFSKIGDSPEVIIQLTHFLSLLHSGGVISYSYRCATLCERIGLWENNWFISIILETSSAFVCRLCSEKCSKISPTAFANFSFPEPVISSSAFLFGNIVILATVPFRTVFFLGPSLLWGKCILSVSAIKGNPVTRVSDMSGGRVDLIL